MRCRSTRSAKPPWPRAIAFPRQPSIDRWLSRAIGENRKLLTVALWHLDRGVSLCALLGEGYVHLADLCFLKGQGQPERLAYLNQALTVRPYDGLVLLSAGSTTALRGDVDGMIAYWRPVLRCREQERQVMVRLLTSDADPGRGSARRFQPDLAAVRLLFSRYTELALPRQSQTVGTYYVRMLGQAIQQNNAESAAPLWFEMHRIYLAINQPAAAVDCLRRRVAGLPTDFEFRYVLGRQLIEQQQFTEAEQQLKWCAPAASGTPGR